MGNARVRWIRVVQAASIAACIACAVPKAHAESGIFNLHVELAGGTPIGGDLAPTDEDPDAVGGVTGMLAVDWQFAPPVAVELMAGGGYFFAPFPDEPDESGVPYFMVGVGPRLRFLDNREGYANEPGGDLLGNAWISGHVGYHNFDGSQVGVDGAIGYEWSVLRPISVGVFVRGTLLFEGERDGADALIQGGVNMSVELAGQPPILDSDGDGLPNEREVAVYNTNPQDADTDHDGVNDGVEVRTHTDPNDPDTDSDSAKDGAEDTNGNGTVDPGEADPRIPDTDEGGVPDGWELAHPPMNPRDATDDDGDHDGVKTHVDRCPDTTPNTDVDANGCAVLRPEMVLAGIEFAFDSAEILPASAATLQRGLQILRDNPDARVEIGGHTDNVGAAGYNQRLSRQRADAVKQWLVEHGIPANRLTTRGYGAEHPAAPNETDEGRARNRRIEFKRLGD